MAKALKHGCKKCSGVVEIERSVSSSGVSFKIKAGEFREDSGKVVVICKNPKKSCGEKISDVDFLLV